jgi:PadR family transcriptional regulator, regulatory protein PadR
VRGEPLKGHLDMLLLAALVGEPRHGYGVMQRLAVTSQGAFDLGEGTIYPALHRLQRKGLLTSHWHEVEGRRRRVYALTPTGEESLTGKRQEWDSFVRGVAQILEAAG